MPDVEKKVGKFTVLIGPPSPRWCELRINNWNGETDSVRSGNLSVEDLYDLRYAIDRALNAAGE